MPTATRQPSHPEVRSRVLHPDPGLKVLAADFVTSAAAGGSARAVSRATGSPHVALAGRSNVGKSTLINALCRRPVARTSAAPGKTRLANIYRSTRRRRGGPGRWSCISSICRATDTRAAARLGEGTAGGRAKRISATGIAGRRARVPAACPAGRLAAPRAASRIIQAAAVAATRSASSRCVVATKIDKLSRAERDEESQGTRTGIWNGRAAGLGGKRRRTGRTVENDSKTGQGNEGTQMSNEKDRQAGGTR